MKVIKLWLLILLNLLSVFTFSQIPNYVPSNGLVAWYPFNGNANDASVLGNNGTINGATLTSDRNSSANSAYYFDGTNDNIIAAPISAITNSVSISLWIKNDNNSGQWNGIITNQPNSNGGFLLQEHSSNKYDWTVAKGSGYHDLWSVSSITNQWDHFVCIIYNNQMKIYINGSLDNSSNIGSSILSSSGNLCFGSRYSNEWFKGKLDDIGIWNRALTQQEITGLYNSCTPNTSTDTQTACDSYTWMDGNTYTASNNTATHTLTNVAGCDSVATLNLTINPTYFTQVSATICDDAVYTFNGNTYNQTGVYLDTLSSVLTCDSVIETTLTVNPTYFTQVSATICDNGTFTTAGGQIVTTTGVYLDTLQSNLSCDSVIETNLQVNPTYFTQVFDTICDNGTFTTAGGQIVTTTGVYLDTLQSNLSCDSVIETNLQVNPTYFTQVFDTICDNGTFTTAGGQVVSSTGVYLDTLQSNLSCDSVIETNLQVSPTYFTQVFDTICDNGTYATAGGQIVTTTGIYLDTLQSNLSCDSVIETNLQVNPTYFTQVFDTICDNGTFTTAGGQIVTTTGIYLDTLQSNLSCDSVIETNLQVNPTYFTQVFDTICDNGTFTTAGGQIVTTTGVYLDTLQSNLSCDSVIETNLQVNPTYFTQVFDTICDNGTFTTAGGQIVTTSGIYLDTLQSNLSCDSVIETNLQVNPTYFTQVFDTICDNGTYATAGGQIVTTTGIYLDTLQSNLSCDSVIETNLQVNPTYFTQVFDTICDNGTFTTAGGQIVTTTGVYLDTLQSNLSCDSVIETNIQVNPTYFTQVFDTICSGDSLLLPDSTFVKTQGVYPCGFSSRSGCDSIIVIQLIVLPSYRTNENATICDGEQYILPNGNIVSKSGTYYSNFNSSLGCDSIIETSLIVLNISNYTLDLDTCEGIYSINGKYFEFSGVYQDTTINYLGCDSIIKYNLKISPLDTTVNVDLSNTQPKLIANEIDAYFQWLLCDSLFYPIPNETSNTFYPTSNGKYSVEISRGICIDTSACYSIQSLGLKQSGLAKNEIRIFPNPSNGNFIIALVNTDFYQYTLEIRAISGGLIHRNNYQGKTNQIELNGELPSGSYLVSIISSKAIETKLIFIR